jgi:Protein of unknown function (DUF3761)
MNMKTVIVFLLLFATPALACPPDFYMNADHTCIHRPDRVQTPDEQPVTAICRDGTKSHSTHHAGTCSSHGGVDHFLPT